MSRSLSLCLYSSPLRVDVIAKADQLSRHQIELAKVSVGA